MFVRLLSSLYICDCRRFSAIGSCVISVQMFDFRHRDTTFICVLVIQASKLYRIKDKKIKSMVICMLQNFSLMYYSHNSNIKYVNSTIKCIGFKSIHYVINFDVVSFFVVFNDFNSMFLSMHS